ncbi:MAG: hypothetical protein MRY63_01515 [Neomegalonema sp.]|nr:hypothetical protein [Neomegalonema sp.]
MTVESMSKPAERVSIEIEITGESPRDAWLIVPRPFDHWGQRFTGFETTGIDQMREIGALNSRCRAYLLKPSGATPPRLRYHFERTQTAAPDWVWEVQRNRFTNAAPDLVETAAHLASGAMTQRQALRRLIDNAAGIFAYDHPEEDFNEGHDAVPMLCGTTKGSCVDINTYLLASALSLGIKGQYIAGYWFHPHKTATLGMHCWLAFEPDGELVFWDLAHGLKWAQSLGAKVEEGLNPAGGRRLAMSCGRGLRFATPHGEVQISHFSEPVWIGPQGRLPRPDLNIRIEERQVEPA